MKILYDFTLPKGSKFLKIGRKTDKTSFKEKATYAVAWLCSDKKIRKSLFCCKIILISQLLNLNCTNHL
jgi:hypothetical protein